jgi:hypothetical protein
LVAKYHAAYAGEGLLFMGVSPGLVATAEGAAEGGAGGRVEGGAEGEEGTEVDRAGMEGMVRAFETYAPGFEGPITPAKSVEMVLEVVGKATIEKDGGAFVSHYGNKQWL